MDNQELNISDVLQKDWVVAPRTADMIQNQGAALTKLEGQGLVTQETTQGGQNFVIVENVDAFRFGYVDQQERKHTVKDLFQKVANSIMKEEGQDRVDRTAFWLFYDVPVVTRQDYESQLREYGEVQHFKTMFNVPQDAQTALDIAEIQRDKDTYLLNLWELGSHPTWQAPMPTYNEGFDSGLTLLDVAVPNMVYAQGAGARDPETGVLSVDTKPGETNSPRQVITGSWFRNNFMRRVGNLNWDAPRNFVEEYGEKWERNGLLYVDDFSLHKGETDIRTVRDAGNVSMGNLLFNVGREFTSSSVTKLTGRQYVVYTQEGATFRPQLIFDAQIDPKRRGECRIINTEVRTQIYVPQTAYQSVRVEDLKPFIVNDYSSGESRRAKIDTARELPFLLQFREAQSSTTKVALTNLSINQQVSVMKLIDELGDDMRGQAFIDEFGANGMLLLADSYMEGGFDEQIFDLFEANNGKALLEQYVTLREATNNFADRLGSIANPYSQVMAERVRQALYYRSRDFLVLASQEDLAEEPRALIEVAECLVAFNDVFTNPDMHFLEENASKVGGQVTSISGIYRSNEGDNRLVVTLRPREAKADPTKGGGQARFSIRHPNSKGESIDIRVDFDPDFGVTLDLGSANSPLAKTFERINKTHHTQEPFEGGIHDSNRFAGFIADLHTTFGWSKYAFSAPR